MSTPDPRDSPSPTNALYSPEACQAKAIDVNATGTSRAAMDRSVLTHAHAQARQRKRGGIQSFGMSKSNTPAYPNPDDYENKYPEDARGEETGPSARVWRTYLDEAQKADAELVDGWRDTTDVLLVFAGLFSAVVATFVAQTSTALEVDYAQVTATLLLETNYLLRAMVNQTFSVGIPPSPLDPASNFSSSASDRWINGLWFASLSVSLVAAFIAVLVKQWIQHYQSVVSGTAQEQVRIRQFRFLGVERWRMPLIISILPMLLHLALFLYFAGLILFLIPLDTSIGYATASVAGLAYIFYFLSTLLPLLYPTCPYKTPLSSLLAWSGLSILALIYSLVAQSHRILPGNNPPSTNESKRSHFRALYWLREAEKKAVEEIADEIEAQAFVWLYSTSSNPTVASITIQAISGLRADFEPSAKLTLQTADTFKANTVERELVQRFFELNFGPDGILEDGVSPKMERLLRALEHLDVALFSPGSASKPHKKTGEPRYTPVNASSRSPHDSASLDFEEDPVDSLESYDYASEHPRQAVMWIILLKRSLRHTFGTQSECWSHAFKVLDRFAHTAGTGVAHDLRLFMMLEYLGSLSFLDSNGVRQQVHPDGGRETQCVLYGAPFNYTEVAPKTYSALSLATVALRDKENIPSWGHLVPTVLQHVLPRLIAAKETYANKDIADVEKDIKTAASGLRASIQTLVESEVLWKDDVQCNRDKYCRLLFDATLWPWALGHISWTQELMDWFLQCNIRLHWSWDDRKELYRYFSDQADQLFLINGGLSIIERKRHGNDFLHHYLEGLLRHGGPSHVQLEHLYQPDNFSHVLQEYIFQDDEPGISSKDVKSLLTKLTDLMRRHPPQHNHIALDLDLHHRFVSMVQELDITESGHPTTVSPRDPRNWVRNRVGRRNHKMENRGSSKVENAV